MCYLMLYYSLFIYETRYRADQQLNGHNKPHQLLGDCCVRCDPEFIYYWLLSKCFLISEIKCKM